MAGISVILQQLRTLMATQNAEGQTDGHLLERFVSQRDEVAFAALLERHGPMVLAVCRRILHDEHRAEDAFQATFLVLVRKASSIRKQQAIASWLHGVALRLARKAKAEATHAKQPDARNHARAAVDAQTEASWHESQEILDEELQRLPETYRLPVVLCYLEGLTRDEAAAQLGWTANKFRGYLERGRNRLRSQLLRRGVTLSAAASGTLLADTLLASAVPPLLAVSTIHAAASFAAGTTLTACGISAPVAALTEGGLKMVASKKITVILALALFTAVLGSGVGIFAQRTDPVEAKQPNEPPALPVVQEALNAQKPKEGRVDRLGDPLPPGAIARLGTTRFRAADEAHSLAFAPDGKTVAVNSRGGLFLFDAVSGKRLKRLSDFFPFQDRPDNAIAFSPDGKHLAVRGHTMHPPINPVNPPRIEAMVQVWDLDRLDKPRAYDSENIVWIGWSRQSEPMGVYQEKDGVSLRNLQSGQSRHFACPKLHRPEFLPCACAPAALLVIADQQGSIHAWNTATGKKRYTLEPEEDCDVYGLAVSGDGRHVAVLRGNHGKPGGYAVLILDGATGRVLHTVATGQRNLESVAFSPDGKTLATVGLSDVRCWDVASGREVSHSQGEVAHSTMVAFAGDGRSLATLRLHSGMVDIWDVATGKRQGAPVGHASGPGGTAFSPDGRRLATGGALDCTIHIWDLAGSKSLRTIHRPYQWVRDVAWSRDGCWIYSTWIDDELWISDAATGERKHVIKLEDPERPDTVQSAVRMHLSADDKTLTAFSYYYAKQGNGGPTSETLITGWDPATRKQLFRRRRAGTESRAAVSADARLLAVPNAHSEEKASGLGPMRIEDLATGKMLLTFPIPEGQTMPLAFSPDSRLLASRNHNITRVKKDDPTSSESQLVLWEVATAREVVSLPTDGNRWCAAFSPDGRLVAIPAPQQTIVVWDLAQNSVRRCFKDFDGAVTSLAFTPDSRRLISGHTDSSLLVWEVPPPSPPLNDKLGADAIAKAWADLVGDDASRAFRARWTLAGAPEVTVPLLAKHLHPAQPADVKRLARLVADLDSDEFAIRTAAQKQLADLGESAVPALRQVLAKGPSLEMRRRAEALLDRLCGPITDPEQRRAVRAVAVLEDAATADARKLLAKLAGGAPDARLTQEARAALERLRR